jgi:hypothetical protein
MSPESNIAYSSSYGRCDQAIEPHTMRGREALARYISYGAGRDTAMVDST